MTEPPIASQPTRPYDGYAQALAHGIEVAFAPLEQPAVLWLPQYRAALINSSMSELHRHTALAHALAHSVIDDTALARLSRVGLVAREVVERAACRVSARAQIPADLLAEELEKSTSAAFVSSSLSVTAATLCWRLDDLNSADRRSIPAELILRLRWDAPVDDGICCIRPDGVPGGAVSCDRGGSLRTVLRQYRNQFPRR